MQYWRIANRDGKVWLMPRQNTRLALELYQPSGWKGRALKSLLPFLSVLPKCCSPFPLMDWEVDDRTRDVLTRIFPGKKLEWALFEGTPSIHQKQVMQVFCGNEILAYCKVSEKEAIHALFAQEAELLHDLRAKGICSIPRCLYCGAIDNGDRQMLVLSTCKTIHSRVPHQWNVLLQSFTDELQAKTQRMIPYEESDLARACQLLRDRWEVLPSCVNKDALACALDDVESRCKGRVLTCAIMHGDFTPWNMFVEKGQLFVFDWEYAFRNCPVAMDRYHFFVQTAFFERHWTAESLMAYAQTREGEWLDKEQLVNYLVLILSRFVGREPTVRKMEDSALLAYCNDIIVLCQSKR